MNSRGRDLVLCDVDNTLIEHGQPNARLIDCLCQVADRVRLWCVTNRSSEPPDAICEELDPLDLPYARVETPVSHLIRIWSKLAKPVYVCCTRRVAQYISKNISPSVMAAQRLLGSLVLLYKESYSNADLSAIKVAVEQGIPCFVGHLDSLSNQDTGGSNVANLGDVARSLLGDYVKYVRILGKPNAEMVQTVAEFSRYSPARTLVVGDNFDVDAALARNLGCDAVILDSGSAASGSLLSVNDGSVQYPEYLKSVRLEELL